VALTIATTWPHLKRFSEKTLWYLGDSLGWNQGQYNASVGDGASDSTGASAAGGHCSSGSK
jgi:hypothetical protein